MKSAILAALISSCLFSSEASATWFARTDSGGKLLVTGVAENPDQSVASVYLTCEGSIVSVEVLTEMNAPAVDIADYNGTKIVLGYKTKDGEAKKMGLNGEPVLSAGDGVAIRAKLTAEQSSALYNSIGRGRRLDVELIHPELTDDTGVKKVMADGFTSALMAMSKACPGLE
ncbi:hypothetical protein G6L33_11210 [Agrobacterium rhizogenes]|nr:hypothetical protein [Rhizobium rhizogenes]NTH64420.1 hypothetical protein [Rhizobium rhizogenes]NTJ32100.1 hypothetical protein [Rhizobium rhizogenes]